MSLLRSLETVAGASGDGAIDWAAVRGAATAAVEPGSLAVAPDERRAYATAVDDAAARIGATTGLAVELPDTFELQHRHHWIDANVATFQRVLAPLEGGDVPLPGLTGRANTATMAALLAFLGRTVQGQYDPPLFDDGPPGLSFVVPNLRRTAERLDVDEDRFRRWIVLHEVTHAAEFGAAPWLVGHLEAGITEALDGLADGAIDREAIGTVDVTMTAVEGYAEFVMDRAAAFPIADLRAKLDAQRRGGGPVVQLVRRLLGLGIKRRQYERGRQFFEAVAEARGVEATAAVWAGPEALPTRAELDRPERWLARVEP